MILKEKNMSLANKWLTRVALFVLPLFSFVFADILVPASLKISQISEKKYSMIWTTPLIGRQNTLKLFPEFSQGVKISKAREIRIINKSYVQSFELEVDDTLRGKKIHIPGLESILLDVFVNIYYMDGTSVTLALQPSKTEVIVPKSANSWDTIKSYFVIGIEHFLGGSDHILFVMCIIFISVRFLKIIKAVTFFTIAHSVTLTLAALGFLNVPGPPVEAIIALSILFLSIEILNGFNGKHSLTHKYPWIVSFSFGLLHGLGFAGALSEIGLPKNHIALALAFFNVGIETAQIGFVICVAGLLVLLRKLPINYSLNVKKIPVYVIGIIASFWFVQRIFLF